MSHDLKEPTMRQIHLVCGGIPSHAYDFVKPKLLELLDDIDAVEVTTSTDYDGLPLDAIDVLLTYTCDVRPSLEEQLRLSQWVTDGGRWFALHATNAAFDVVVDSSGAKMAVPRFLQVLDETLGSHFLAHPPLGPFDVRIKTPEHPLVQGLAGFSVSDELYLSEFHTDVDVLLYCHFVGEALRGFPHSYWPEDVEHPVMYLRRLGTGEVLYLTLGHCRNADDAPVPAGELPEVPGAWAAEEFYELLRRGLRWCLDPDAISEDSAKV
jgi:type 1 glutamine amidotransferase